VHAKTHGDRTHTRLLRHRQVVFTVTNHQRLMRLFTALCQYLLHHERMRLGSRLVGTPRNVEQIGHGQFIEHAIEATATLARRNRQLDTTLTQRQQCVQCPVEQRWHVWGAAEVVPGIRLGQPQATFFVQARE
tara:strand:- start:26401 stop:26799 length:399 start_codon:yes stop_codon:yes gene_type:complete